MSLPDTAEYWWDVKGYNSKPKHIFTHIKGIECGHYHVFETDCTNDIDCFVCKKILAELPDIKEELDRKFYNRMYPNGKCSCGGHFVVRKNKLYGEEFLGCSKYPKCKKTKSK